MRQMMTHRERLRDESGFIHKSFIGKAIGGIAKKVIGSVPIVGGFAEGLIDQFTGTNVIPGTAGGCPPGFIQTAQGCVPTSGGTIPFERRGGFAGGVSGVKARFGGGAPSATTPLGAPVRGVPFTGARNGAFPQPSPVTREFREGLGLAADPAAGVAVMGRFGAGFEPTVFESTHRDCGRRGVLGADGICYNKGDLRNSDRWWPRGRRPLLTGGEMRAISTASSAAKKLQRKQKQLEGLGLLKKAAPRTRRALPPGHTAQLSH